MRRRPRQPDDHGAAVDTARRAATVTPTTLDGARPLLGEVLIGERRISSDELAAAIDLQHATGRRLGAILVEERMIDAQALTDALANQLGLVPVDLRVVRPTSEAMALVPEELARRCHILPLRLVDDALDVAVADATDARVRDALAALPVSTVNVMLATAADVDFAINAYYRILTADDAQVQQFWAEAEPAPRSEVEVIADAPVIQLVNKLIAQALRDRASDIHIEPTDGSVRIRYRVDGALREVLSLPSNTGPELVSRIKVMSDMDIVERRRPQDGQFQVTVDGAGVDVRVATASTIWGETAVLRLLDKSRSMKQLGELGMPMDSYQRFLSIVHKPYGMIVCSGPTGSGKTTTLYASLAEISRSELNIMTIEDPVEYVFPSVNQMQIHQQADVTFASGLKSILRQDPDVILVGEIRDEETARIAVQSALTGHLVMSSIHATDASAALFRLLDMGIESFLVASSLVGVVGQRLVRKICPSCIETYEPPPQERKWYEQLGGPVKSSFVRGAGCHFCSHTGYRDRVGVYEVLEVTDEIAQQLVTRSTPRTVREIAIQQGMRTMGQEAMQLVAHDVTTIAEVIRNVYVA
jgi:type IV pilus assembly protein PilB